MEQAPLVPTPSVTATPSVAATPAVTAPLAAPGPRTVVDELDERLQVRTLASVLLHVRIPILARTYYLGGITLFLFGIQLATGTLLTLYYKPTPEAAYESVLFISSEVTFGWLIRSIHHWTANLMILTLVLHVIRIFFQAAYKYPRELTWIVGAGLLMVTIGFGFTGYLLPWDQRAFWATVVGTEIVRSVPFVGEDLLLLLRGGPDITDATLTRFFSIHVLVLPLAFFALIGVHLLFVHQTGLANPMKRDPRPHEVRPTGEKEKTKAFFPNYILDEVLTWYVVLAALVVLASLFPAGLEEEANPLVTPEHTKPEWYFLGVYELLKHVPRLVGVLAPVVAIVVIAMLPLLDRNPEVRPRRRPLAIALGVIMIVGLVGLTIRGYFS
jgi:ubiquinol-cytochrome c reductase cytochrome b subunit